jgi:nitrite reductase/ring-hydroxylating ferredoxin subunit
MPGAVTTQTPPPPAGKAVRVTAGGKVVAVFNIEGTLRAIDAICPHVGGPLERGQVSGGVVTCPLHGSQFDLATGALKRGPAARAVSSYPVRVENGNLVIELP